MAYNQTLDGRGGPQGPPESESDLSLAHDILAPWPAPGQKIELTGLNLPAAAFVLSQALKTRGGSCLVVVPTAVEAEDFARDLAYFWPEGAAEDAVRLLPAYDMKPFSGQAPSPELVFERLWALYGLLAARPPLAVIASAPAALQRSLPGRVLSRSVDLIAAGQELDREAFLARLAAWGYEPAAMVQGPGEFSVRGGILDLYPPGLKQPVRLELFGDYVESIRLFRTLDQRSMAELDEVVLLPAREILLEPERIQRVLEGFRALADAGGWTVAVCAEMEEALTQGRYTPGLESFLPLFYDRLDSPSDYAGPETVRLVFGPDLVASQGEEHLERLEVHLDRLRREQEPHLDPERLFLFPGQLEAELSRQALVRVSELPLGRPDPAARRLELRLETNQDLRPLLERTDTSVGLLAPLAARVKAWLEQDLEITLVCHTEEQARRMADLLHGYGLSPEIELKKRRDDRIPAGRFRITSGFLSAGFVWPAWGTAFVTEDELFGPKRRMVRRAVEEIRGVHLSSFQDLAVGDFVVHTAHGVAQYQGLVKLMAGGFENDYLLLAYRGNDRLYVPVDRFSAVQKYIGADGHPPRLDRLGGEAWERIKAHVKASIREMAEDLIRLYATRQSRQGHSFKEPDAYFHEFEAEFKYEETPDQLAAIEEVMANMGSDKPMDRLVCGDVGFGKTEVAMRASFRAVLDGKQVALLVPTTVLAEQHHQTFKERFQGYPVSVDVLSRFKTRAEQRETLERLAAGKLDILIGTHRLLGKDVAFRDLGLLIIDEEHRFGVVQKEKLKKLKLLVDVLALSATPIPRSLQMSLTAIRDLSTIETPPEDRRSIKSFLLRYDEAAVAEAVAQELDRGGQVFFVHNRIKDIDLLAGRLSRLMPLVRFGVAHGQLHERTLEKVMLRFLSREIDVLVTTNIIESGLDIPTANTIIINNADRFGLAQIYQLRGRVGRSNVQAYAYLLVSSLSNLTPEARKRLKALLEFTDLGSGFKIALHDLQIRGAGNLLGAAQHGHVTAVGYEMYFQLMEEAIHELKGEPQEERIDPEIVMGLPAFIPETYVPDTEQRLVHYRRFSVLKTSEELTDLLQELTDRYGPPPAEVNNLAHLIELKQELARAGVRKLEMGREGMTFSFAEKTRTAPERVLELVKLDPDHTRFYPDGRLFLAHSELSAPGRLERARNILQRLA